MKKLLTVSAIIATLAAPAFARGGGAFGGVESFSTSGGTAMTGGVAAFGASGFTGVETTQGATNFSGVDISNGRNGLTIETVSESAQYSTIGTTDTGWGTAGFGVGSATSFGDAWGAGFGR